ncbi:MAG: 2-phospho-L-lactate transferase CofD family protein, partial [Actinobacteria bacterium]|nr:2-phospho-L-lactate transferase CofD family protein [Actinomycetota bacterium]
MSGAFSARKGVAIGGGTGLPRVLRCLLELGFDTSAVVTMADDGGSSGLLREQMGMLPPGDIRNCLVAMADADSL